MENTNFTATEIRNKIRELTYLTDDLEATFIENGGEVTEDTDAKADAIDAIADLLEGEGIDALGRWLKAKQDQIAAAKAEVAAAQARVKSLGRTEAYIKSLITGTLTALRCEEVKGTYYKFTRDISVHSAVNTAALNDRFYDMALKAVRAAGLPGCVDIDLKTDVTRLRAAGDEYTDLVITTSEDAVRFSKPRKAEG